jgi:hypothetical protein
MFFEAVKHLTEALCLNALFTLQVENSPVLLVGTKISTMFKVEWQFNLPFQNMIDK